ncbi:MAG TPA: ligase-associated DNA damage response exonuclease [Vicinamibacterales bacterium]|jgi:putative mRNA 3-end processing factor|nr:ligase-associated DNA damage response exonuclease [Vicinamibacterales bacterium]
MLTETSAGLFCPAGGFHIDPWQPVPRAIITHAHGDHARPGSDAYLCTTDCARLLRRRFGSDASIQTADYGEIVQLGSVEVSFHPAGHVLGSAQIRLSGADGVWVISGDYKRAADATCTPFEPLRCDTFITESTFALPIYRWDATDRVVDDIAAWWSDNATAGRTSVLFCYTIGKAQRVLAELGRLTDRIVFVHGMMLPMIDAYREAGIHLLPVASATERPRGSSFAGELVLAPLPARGTPWMRRLGEISDAFASGLMRVRGVRRQRAFDRGFVLSDHADWPALLGTIAETGATRVLATHGHAEPLARYLREMGQDAGIIRTAWEGEVE